MAGFGKACVAAAVVAAMGAMARGEETAALEARVRELEAKLAAVEARQSANTQEMAATIGTLLKDAESRSRLLTTSGDFSAGYDNGFFVRSGDDFVWRPYAQFQFRYDAAYTEEGNNTEAGFEVRKMKFGFEGTVFKDFEYEFGWETNREGGSPILEDAWARYRISENWKARVGQFKDPMSHEQIVSSTRNLTVDRSLMNKLIGGGDYQYIQGAEINYGAYNPNNPWNVFLAFHDGIGEDNTNFTDHEFDFGLSGRVEYKVFGNWRSYRDFSAIGNKESMLVLGTAGDWSQGEGGNYVVGTVDVQYETPAAPGLGLYGAAIVRRVDAGVLETADDVTDWGLLGQAGWLILPAVEVFGRYDVTFLDKDPSRGEFDGAFQAVTVGMHYYLGKDGAARHRAKLSFDVMWLPDGSPSAATGLGIPEKSTESEVVFRGQFQLLL